MDVTNLLSAITAKFASSAEIETIKKSLPEISSNIDREIVRTVSILQQQPSLATLQTQQQLWQQFQQQTTGWLNVLTQQATLLQDELDRLADLQKTWSSTRAAMQASKQPGLVLQQINSTLAAIAAAQAPLQAQRTTVLDFQSRVAREVERCGNALAQINRVADMAVEGILVRDSKPIWSAEHWSKELPTLAVRGSKIADAFRMEALQYIRNPYRGMPLHAALFVALMLMFCAARRQVRKWKAANESVSPALEVFETPYAAALAAPLFIVTSALSLVPAMVRVLCQILAIVPVILLLRPVITPLLLPALYMLAALHVFDALRQTLVIVPLIAQVILSMETLGAIGVAGWTLKNLQPRGEAAESTVLRTLRLAALLALFILPVALLAGITGFMRLAGLLTTGIIAASGLALALYASVRVSTA